MQPFPHQYRVSASAAPEGDVTLSGDRLSNLASAPPAEFDGPGDRWSPETLLVASIADCFILTFRSIATIAKLRWVSLACEVHGTVERVDRVTQFTAFTVHARLGVAPGADHEQARRLLDKAEAGCLVSNSLKPAIHLESDVRTMDA
jgi:organic hydroperoxide reductase OsmC/OhrA